MTDLFDQLPAIAQSPPIPSGGAKLSKNGKPIGRPRGALNKGSVQLAKYLEARFGGMTPGQQLAEFSMVTRSELKRAKGSMWLAMATRAQEIAPKLQCTPYDAIVLLEKGLIELMGYVHQKQPAATPEDVKQLPTMFVVEERDLAQAALAAPGDVAAVEILEDFDLPADQVARAKSHDAT
jgi:hypothetical protein